METRMEHMEDDSLIVESNCEIIGAQRIELSEAEVQEAAVAAESSVVECIINHSQGTECKLELESELPQQILSTEGDEDTQMSQMVIDETQIISTFVNVSEPDDVDGDTDITELKVIPDEGNNPSNLDDDPYGSILQLDVSCETVGSETVAGPGPVSSIQLPFAFPGQSFNEQAQKLILNVWDFFKRAKKDPNLVHNLRGPQDHAAAALNVGTKTIGKIAKRVIRLGKLETPGKKRNRPKTVLDSIDAEGEEVIRRIIRDMYDRRVAPTIPLVLTEAKAKLNFKGSTTSLRRILKRMGYKYGGIDNSLIQTDKLNVSGWKEKTSKKSKSLRGKQPKTKATKKFNKQTNELPPIVAPVVPQIVEADGIIQSHEICQQDLIQPHEVIIHYQKPDDSYISQSGQNQIITVTTDPAEIIQLQLDSNGETVPVTVVQEWQWQSLPKMDCSNDATAILGLKGL